MLGEKTDLLDSAAAEETPVIHCPACNESMLAPLAMIGQLVECPFCQHQFVIALPVSVRDPVVIQAELDSLENQLRENETQITELRGHVSRINMELHRYQLRMQALTQRQGELHAGITKAQLDLID